MLSRCQDRRFNVIDHDTGSSEQLPVPCSFHTTFYGSYTPPPSTMKSFLSLMLVVASVQAFAPAVPNTRAATELQMGLFDFLQPKKSDSSSNTASNGQDLDVFAGRGKRITIREDEDNAMWIDEPKDKKKGGK